MYTFTICVKLNHQIFNEDERIISDFNKKDQKSPESPSDWKNLNVIVNTDLHDFKANCFTFDIHPIDGNKGYGAIPYDYLFRGMIMDWISSEHKYLGAKLHQTDKANLKKIIREYAIWHTKLRTNEGKIIQGAYRFHLNIFNNTMINLIFDRIMAKETTKITLGHQDYVISAICINHVDLIDLYHTARPVNKFAIRFLTPTAFNSMKNDELIYVPEPQRIFSNIMKQWHSIFANTQYDTPKDLFGWIKDSVKANRMDISMRRWEMGKGKNKFHGFMGYARFSASDDCVEYQRWLHCLLKFGELTSTGKGRTSGFGHYKITEY